MLGYRFANFRKASEFRFDASRFTHSLRELARNLAATSPDDGDLQAELFGLLQQEDNDLRSEKWVEFDTVAIESVLFACREWPGGEKYMGELAEITEEIWRRRSENRNVEPSVFGKRLGDLGFTKKPRNAKGVALQLSDATCSHAQQFARDFNIPEVEGGEWTKTAAQGIEE